MKRKSLALVVLTGVVGVSAVAFAAQLTGQWPVAGLNPANTRNQAAETRIGVTNVDRLAPKWVLETAGDVSATPAVHGRFVYVPDWEGNIYAVDRNTGEVVWQRTASSVTGVPAKDFSNGPGGIVRTTPAVAGNLLIMGDQGGRAGFGAKVFALDRATGATRWVTQLQGLGAGGDNSPGSNFAIVTQSPIVDDDSNVVYVGTASWEEAMSAFIPNYPCCSFRGMVAALEVTTGRVLWTTYMAPVGYSGNGVWGSTAAIDAKRESLYVTTGNNYSAPPNVLDCIRVAADDAAKHACLDPANHFDAIVALNLETGAIRWATRALPYDVWNVNCIELPGIEPAGVCPDPAGPDYDFGQGPMLFEANVNGKKRDLLGAGQKSGKFWALDPDTGAVAWVTQVGPGGTMGGLQWGSAVDDRRIYVAVNNSGQTAWEPNGTTTIAGAWSALDKNTGQILWHTVTPDLIPGLGAAIGPVTVANGVAYACSFAGTRVALRATDGAVLWQEPSTGEFCGAGAAVSQGAVFWGIGYGQIAFMPVANGKLTAYSVK